MAVIVVVVYTEIDVQGFKHEEAHSVGGICIVFSACER